MAPTWIPIPLFDNSRDSGQDVDKPPQFLRFVQALCWFRGPAPSYADDVILTRQQICGARGFEI